MDLNSNAFRIVQTLTEKKKQDRPRALAARSAGKLGGPARAKRLSAEQRHEIALKANRARWNNGV